MDRIIRCITTSGSLMAAAIDTSNTCAVAQEIHKLSATTAAVLGRTLSGTALIGSMLKQDKASVTVKINGGGPVGNVVAISDSHGNVRGYVDRPLIELPLRPDGKLDVGGAVGCDGRLGVIRDYGTGEPYIGQVELVSGEIAEDFTSYYAVSEQIPTACALGVLTEKGSSQVLLAGGFLIQVMPGALESEISTLEKNLADIDSMTTMLAKGLTLEEIVNTALAGIEWEKLDETSVHYACTCNREKYAAAMITLGKEELKNLPYIDGKVEAVCPYCEKRYYFSKEDIEHLIENATK